MKIQFIQLLKTLLKEGGCILIGDVAFHTRSDLEKCHKENKDGWDEDEIYFVVDELRKASDKGYTDTVKELRRQGKKVVGIGEKKAPKELRDACSEFFEIK